MLFYRRNLLSHLLSAWIIKQHLEVYVISLPYAISTRERTLALPCAEENVSVLYNNYEKPKYQMD